MISVEKAQAHLHSLSGLDNKIDLSILGIKI